MSHISHLHNHFIMSVTFLVLLLQRSLTHGLTTNTFDENNDETFFLNQIADIIKENRDQITNHKYQR